MSVQDESAAQGALGGASSGAMAGAAVGIGSAMAAGAAAGSVVPVVGTAIGAVVGAAIGLAGGFLSGKKKKKAAKYMKKARRIQQQREEEAYKQSLLSQIRQARISRASMLATTVAAGTEEGSGAMGALSSYGSQTANVVEYMSNDRQRAIQAANYAARAGKNLSTAQAIDTTTSGIIDLGASIAKAYGSYKSAQAQQMQPQQQGGLYDAGRFLGGLLSVPNSNPNSGKEYQYGQTITIY